MIFLFFIDITRGFGTNSLPLNLQEIHSATYTQSQFSMGVAVLVFFIKLQLEIFEISLFSFPLSLSASSFNFSLQTHNPELKTLNVLTSLVPRSLLQTQDARDRKTFRQGVQNVPARQVHILKRATTHYKYN